jgi:hypothetical protein
LPLGHCGTRGRTALYKALGQGCLGFSDNAPNDRAGWLDCVDQINPFTGVNDSCVEIVGRSRFGITGKLSGIRGELLLAPIGRRSRHTRTAGLTVRLRAPRGVSHVQLFSGVRRTVAADGTVEMTGSDARPLLKAGWVKVDTGDLSHEDAAVSQDLR